VKRDLILFIPSIERGGVEKNLFLILNFLQKKFKKIYIITANANYKKSFGKKIIVLCPNSHFWVNKKRFFKTLVSIFILVKKFFSKNVIILSFQSNVSAILVSKIFNFKIIIRLNTSIRKYIKSYWLKLIYRFCYNLSDEIIVNSIIFKKELKKILKLNSVLIYNSYEKSKKKEELKYFKNYKHLKILNIARLTDQKDQITLIKSLKLLLSKNIKFKCCIIGTGVKKKFLKEYIFKNKLNKIIKLVGYKNDAKSYIEKSSLFILSSKYEGLPNVLIEAQSKNIPIISSDCPTGPREILLNGKLGDLFRVGDYKNLCNLIYKFVRNKTTLIAKSKKAQIYLNRFDLEKNCKKYENIILKYL